jgi:hypothetical protein
MASKRVIVEHAIGFITAFQILSTPTKFRNSITKNWVDEVIFQVAFRIMEFKNTLLINTL